MTQEDTNKIVETVRRNILISEMLLEKCFYREDFTEGLIYGLVLSVATHFKIEFRDRNEVESMVNYILCKIKPDLGL